MNNRFFISFRWIFHFHTSTREIRCWVMESAFIFARRWEQRDCFNNRILLEIFSSSSPSRSNFFRNSGVLTFDRFNRSQNWNNSPVFRVSFQPNRRCNLKSSPIRIHTNTSQTCHIWNEIAWTFSLSFLFHLVQKLIFSRFFSMSIYRSFQHFVFFVPSTKFSF